MHSSVFEMSDEDFLKGDMSSLMPKAKPSSPKKDIHELLMSAHVNMLLDAMELMDTLKVVKEPIDTLAQFLEAVPMLNQEQKKSVLTALGCERTEDYMDA